MKRLREKWNSSQGASILVALLLMLICMMVASSVLMAAASNAGKTTRRSLEEHQKYLTLSSALRLVCGEIEGSSYQGAYNCAAEDVRKWEQVYDNEGNPIYEESGNPKLEDKGHDYFIYTYKQLSGTYTCGLNGTSTVLPLGDQLDHLFWQKKSVSSSGVRDVHSFEPQDVSSYRFPATFDLTVEAPDFDPVTINLSLNESGNITLTASLSGDDFTVAAELLLVEQSSHEPVSLNEAFALESTEGEYPTKTVSWKLNWIAKKGA